MQEGHPSCRFFVIRHGETQWNHEERYQGHEDSPLTETGHRQAEAVANRAALSSADRLISSDLGRACQTAEWIAESTGLHLNTDARLRERHFGVFEGLTIDEIKDRHPIVYEQYRMDDPDFVIPGGESQRQHYKRSTQCLKALAESAHGKNIILVAHGGTLECLFRFIAALPLSQPRCMTIANTSLSVLSYGNFYGTDRWVIETWGDVGHLAHMAPILQK